MTALSSASFLASISRTPNALSVVVLPYEVKKETRGSDQINGRNRSREKHQQLRLKEKACKVGQDYL